MRSHAAECSDLTEKQSSAQMKADLRHWNDRKTFSEAEQANMMER
jgi:hypothetical protein